LRSIGAPQSISNCSRVTSSMSTMNVALTRAINAPAANSTIAIAPLR
jgi:hypothetical protein